MQVHAGPNVPASFPRRSAAVAVALLTGATVVGLACGDEVAFGPQTVASLTISQNTASLVVGESIQLTAAPRDENGVAFSGPTVVWVSDKVAVAVVSEAGLLSAVGAGSAVITATAEGKQASVTVTVMLPPAIGLSVTSVAFVGSQGGGDPPEQRISMSNVGGAAFTNVGIGAITYNEGEPVGWLSTALNLSEDTITVRASHGGLSVGTYQARVPIVAPGASNSPFNFVVSLSVSDVLEIVISATNLDFSALEGTGNPASQNVTITDLGGGPLFSAVVDTIVYQSGANWLNANVAGNQLSIQPNVAGLSVGIYTANVRIAAPGAINTPGVSVSLTVSSTPQIKLVPRNVNFAATVGAADPVAQNVLITSAGTGDLGAVTLGSTAYGAGQPTGWLSSAITDTTITLQAALGTLTDGVYTATLPVVATGAGNSPQNINVIFVVGTNPAIGLSSSSVTAVAEQASGIDVFDTVTVSNIGNGALTQLTVGNITYGPNEPTGWLAASLNGSVAPAVLQLVSSVGALAPGPYTATVDVADPAASNSPVTVSISLSVTPETAAAIEAVSAVSLNGTVAAVVTPTPTVRVLDASSNPVQGVNVTFSAAAGSVSQSSVITNASGQAATTWTLGTVAGVQTLTAAVAGLPGSPVAFTATASAGIASQVVITQQPISAQAGVTFSPAFVAQISDQFGNNVAETRSVTASIATGSPALLGTLTRSTSAGTGAATFAGLSIGGVTGIRTLRFASGTLTAALSNSVSITAGIASQLTVATQPSNVTSNTNFMTSARLHDVYGNNVLSNGVNVTVSKFSGNGTLTGVTTRVTSLGVATFSGMRITGQTTGFGSHRLNFASTGLTSTTTNTFTVAVSLSHNVQPIFSASCATSGCHDGTFSPNLVTGDTHGQTVGVASTCTAGTLVVVGSSATSVLMLRMDGGSCGAMPPTGAISATLRSIVRTWIDEGAANN